jgi:hypothetical protein
MLKGRQLTFLQDTCMHLVLQLCEASRIAFAIDSVLPCGEEGDGAWSVGRDIL